MLWWARLVAARRAGLTVGAARRLVAAQEYAERTPRCANLPTEHKVRGGRDCPGC